MHPQRTPLLVICVSILTLVSCAAETITDRPSSRVTTVSTERFETAIQRAREVLAPRLDVHPALVAVVAVDGQVVWSEAMGWADREAGTAATPATRFRLYSVSKAVTGTLAARLAEQGKLDLDVGILRYLPDLPETLRGVTTRQLLGHLAGIRHYEKGEWMKISRRRCETAREALTPFITDPLNSEPGAQYAYTTFGFVLASAVIEAAAGEPFYRVLEEEIYEPAGMSHTSLDTPAVYDDSTATFYWEKRRGKTVVADPKIDNSCKCGGGGLLTSTEDVARFGIAVLEGTLVNEESTELLATSQQTSSGERTRYSLGWSVSEDGTQLGHSGGSAGGRSYLLIDRAHGIVVALMTNYEGEGLQPEAKEVLKSFQEAGSGDH